MAASDDHEQADSDAGGVAEKQRLNLEVKIDPRGACQRHVTVVVAREDIERYFDEAMSEIMPKAAVPGFRAGRAPRALVKSRFKKEVAEQVKNSLLMDSMEQVTEDHKLAAISEPDLDASSIELPEEGALTFEFNLEVRPDFDVPEWKGLKIERSTREFTDKDVTQQLHNLLAEHGRLVAFDGPASPGDYIATHLTFKHGDEVISSSQDEVIRLRPVLSFRDGRIEAFDKLMTGVTAGETRHANARLSADAPNTQLRGKEVTATFEVLEVKKLELPQLSSSLLEKLGDFKSEDELRAAVRKMLERRLSYHQQQTARRQITAALTVAASWDLPKELLQKQTQRELDRAVMELRRSGFSESEIRAHENELRQNSTLNTTRALKEHFILERIAEDEKIDAEPHDYDEEVRLIAEQTGGTARRVRAQLEKRNQMDALRNQIVERKTIELILQHATFKEVPYKLEGEQAEAVDQSAGGGEESPAIPEAQFTDETPRPGEPRKTSSN